MTDFRALCEELLEWAERTSSHYYKQADVIVRARAALAEPDGCDFPVCIDDDSKEGTCSRWLAGGCEGPASAARRPKSPSVKEQALALLQPGEPRLFNSEMQDTIRRAIEALSND